MMQRCKPHHHRHCHSHLWHRRCCPCRWLARAAGLHCASSACPGLAVQHSQGQKDILGVQERMLGQLEQ